MAVIQLDFFKSADECEMDTLRAEIKKLHTSLDKQRKSLFARSNEVGKMCFDLNERLSILERNICRGNDVRGR